jgi:predicted GH43/DUF377 family glycosyl hydrolase
VFNPAFISIQGKQYLVVRVDERISDQPKCNNAEVKGMKHLRVPYVHLDNCVGIGTSLVQVPSSFDPDNESILPDSARIHPTDLAGPELMLCFISHLRLADVNGNAVAVRTDSLVFPSDPFTQFGCEDPRATTLEDLHIVTFNGIGRFGATGWAAAISSNGAVERKWMLFGPDHKHCALFPGRIKGRYIVLTRPLTRSTVSCDGIWVQTSPDLVNWGSPCPLILPRPKCWDSVRVGPGASPLRIPNGWLLLYYGVDQQFSYHIGAALLEHEEPQRVIARANVPVLSPCLPWERNGRRADTVFGCGAQLLEDGGTVRIYYGAADTHIGAADLKLKDLNKVLKPIQ